MIWRGTDDMPLSVRLYDLSGRTVRDYNLEGASRNLDLSGIPAGTYLIDVVAPGNLRQSARIVVLQ